jgi:hypothetical protein
MYRIVFAFLLLTLSFSCGKKEDLGNSEEEKRKSCNKILESSKKELAAIVQPPSLNPIKTKTGSLAKIDFPSTTHIVGGINILSLQRLGIFNVIKRNVNNWYHITLGMNLLGMLPGRDLESIFWATEFPKDSFFPNKLSAQLLGNFKATDVINKVVMISKTGRFSLPVKAADKGLSINYNGITHSIFPKSSNSLIYSDYGLKTSVGFNKNSMYKLMKKNIPNDTTLWFIAVNPPVSGKGVPKVLKKSISQIKQIAGYINIDNNRNLECQFRFKFSNGDAASATKELLKLGLSRMLNKFGPIINKSFNLNEAGQKSIVSRGNLVRVLFKLDRFQTRYLMRLLGSFLRKNKNLIPSFSTEPAAVTPPVIKDQAPVLKIKSNQ